MSSYVVKRGEVISRDLLEVISKRYHIITRAVNREFRNSEDDTKHSLYVGSYGRGTSIDASDIDMLVELPEEEYQHFDCLKGNGQSRLLQAVKKAVEKSYPTSSVCGDGQVVVIDFSDGMKFEILPAFKNLWSETFIYPDTHMGGRWMSTNPKAEQAAMQESNKRSNGLLFDTCKHIRRLKNEKFSSSTLSGIVIDSFVYATLGNWHWGENESYSNSNYGDYELMLRDFYNQNTFYGTFPLSLHAPGSQQNLDTVKSSATLKKILDYMCE